MRQENNRCLGWKWITKQLRTLNGRYCKMAAGTLGTALGIMGGTNPLMKAYK